MIQLAAALDSPQPLDLLTLASSLLEALTPDSTDRLTGVERPGLEETLESMLGTNRRETTALLTVWRRLTTDPAIVASIDAQLGERRHQLPQWLRHLDQAQIEKIALVSDDYGDAENVILGVKWPSKTLTVVTLLDHLAGGAVKDGFPIAEPFDEVIPHYQAADADLIVTELDPGMARAMLTAGIEHGRHVFPPNETETWPQLRPLLSWLARLLPAGVDLAGPEPLDDQEIDELVEAFFSSPFADGLSRSRHEDPVSLLVSYAGGYGRADPLAWSPAVVEILLEDWYPRKVFAPPEHGLAVVEALPAFVEFAHHRRGLPRRATEETLDAVRYFTADFAIRLADDVKNWIEPIDDWDSYMLGQLAERVGGHEALASLDLGPLPDEPFEHAGIDDDIVDQVDEILDMLDLYCDQHLDVECRTVCRRMLGRIATGEPAIFRRRALPEAIAAGIVYMAIQSNSLSDGPTVKSILEWFGLKPAYGLSDRATSLRRALGTGYRPGAPPGEVAGDPSLLASATRQDIAERAERYRTAIENRPHDEDR